MLYQSEYLKSIESQDLLMLADNVTHPLCEYFLVLINYGILGLFVIFYVLFVVVKNCVRMYSEVRLICLMLFSGVAILALFSYPFRYPLTLISLLNISYVVFEKKISLFNRTIQKTIYGAELSLVVLLLVFFIPWAKAQIRWNTLIDNMDYQIISAHDLIEYDKIGKILSSDAFFLYSHAVVCYKAQLYTKSCELAEHSSKIYVNYDTELLLGNIYEKLEQYEMAEYHYSLASDMCPSRLMLLYYRFNLYKQMKCTEKMETVGRQILKMPLKINNVKAREIKLYVKQGLLGI